MGSAFVEGVALLETYPIAAAGGIDWILQTASELTYRRLREEQARSVSKAGLTSRLKASYWSGLTSSMTTAEEEEEDPEVDSDEEEGANEDEGNMTEKPASSLTSMASSFWKGVTKPTIQEPPRSPTPPLSPTSPGSPPPPDPSPTSPLFGDVPVGPRIWEYAEKLKSSDTAATLSKVSTNWRARAVDAWNQRKANGSPAASEFPLPSSPAQSHRSRLSSESMPPDGYTPPPRPAVFRSPKEDTKALPKVGGAVFVSARASSPEPAPAPVKNPLDSLVRSTREQFTSLVRSQTADAPPIPTRSSTVGPRPLLLSTSPVVSPVVSSRSAIEPSASQSQWSAVMKHKGRFGGVSTQSISSLSPSDALNRPWDHSNTNSDHGSDSESRIVPLRQRSVSPMAMASKHRSVTSYDSPLSSASTSSMADKGLPPIPRSPVSSERGWGQVDLARHPDEFGVVPSNGRQGQIKNLGRTPPTSYTPHPIQTSFGSESDSSVSQVPVTLTPKTRTKKYRPTRLQTKGPGRSPHPDDKVPPLPSSNMLFPSGRIGDDSPTPRASEFEGTSMLDGIARWTASPANSLEGSPEPTIRQLSVDHNDARTRKTSGGSSRSRGSRRNRESAAVEGDDEGYDDLLSAYSEEESRRRVAIVQ